MYFQKISLIWTTEFEISQTIGAASWLRYAFSAGSIPVPVGSSFRREEGRFKRAFNGGGKLCGTT